MLTWNPGRFKWHDLSSVVEELTAGRVPVVRGPNTGVNRWTCSNIKDFSIGDRLPLLKQGGGLKGFVGVARCLSNGSYEDVHYADSSRTTRYVDLEWELLIDPTDVPPITMEDLRPDIAAQVNWNARNSGQRFLDTGLNSRSEVGDYIYSKLQSLCGQVSMDHLSQDEQHAIGARFSDSGAQEGKRRIVTHMRRERSGMRRDKLDAYLDLHGVLSCESCGLKNDTAGEFEESVFEVHHNAPLSLGPRRTELSDLSVLCANCHRMIHALMRKRGTSVEIAEIRALLDS